MSHGLGKGHIIYFHQEGQHIAPFPAPKAVKYLLVTVYRKRRCFLLMKGAESEKIFSPFFQGHIFRNQIKDICSSLYLLYLLWRNMSFQDSLPLVYQN